MSALGHRSARVLGHARLWVTTAVLVGAVSLGASGQLGSARLPGAETAASGTFHVAGNEIVSPNGSRFVPYGVVIECLSFRSALWNEPCGSQTSEGNTGSSIVTAAADNWDANVVRFQVAQENLFSGPGGSVNQAYVRLVDSMVDQANSLGMVAILTLQEENQNGYAEPTASSAEFWTYMAGQFKNNSAVFFDLFNEPALPASAFGPSGTTTQVWKVWRNGGSAGQVHTSNHALVTRPFIAYVGMQTLVNDIRAQGASNIIIAEGPNSDKDLSGLPTYGLDGSNIAYGVEPNLHGDFTQTQQYHRFGQYAASVPVVPEAFLDAVGSESCDPNSATDLPKLEAYLLSIHMGLIYWSLVPGVGIEGTNLNDPTSYPAGGASIASRQCPYLGGGTDTSPTNKIGPGADIRSYFRTNSVKALT